MFLGALSQSLPDIDFVFAFFVDVSDNLLAHRGITHSLFFLLLSTPLLAWLGYRKWKGALSWRGWIFFMALETGTHLFLDSLNNYGMGLLEPFDDLRIALHTIFVADPVFTIWPLIAMAMLIILPLQHRKRKFWYLSGITLSMVYLLFATINKIDVESDLETSLQQQGIAYEQRLSTPTPFNNLLWFVAAGGKDGYYVGYRSIFDSEDSISYQYFPRNEHLLQKVRNRDDVEDLIRFSQGFYTVEQWGDTVVFNDLRFGQVVGWYDPEERFVFHYFLDLPDKENRLVVQRGRFAEWNSKTIDAMWKRIRGERK